MGTVLWIIYLGILGAAAIGFLLKGKYKTVYLKLDFVVSVITWIGLFGFVTDMNLLTPLVWKIVFVCALLWDVCFGILFNKMNGEDVEEMKELSLFAKRVITFFTMLVLLGPLYVGLFHYAFF
ncbi:hypothetical protein ACNRWW_06600 [Metabacillus sp. HB246100]